MAEKIFTNKRYLVPIKCLEDGVIYNDIRHLCSVIYGMEFRAFNSIGKIIDKGRKIRGNHYLLLKD